MNELRIRSYNVRFGDAFLISLPDKSPEGDETMRHIVIDIGIKGRGKRRDIFFPVIDDISAVTDNKAADLYIMTHEHMDHVQGLLYCAGKGKRVEADFTWLTASADPLYYENNPKARKQKLSWFKEYEEGKKHVEYFSNLHESSILSLFEINDPKKTDDCVQHIRDISEKCTYIHRDSDLTGTHPFTEAEFDIWGPEKDTSIYYKKYQGLFLGEDEPSGSEELPTEKRSTIVPPPGVDAGVFFNLVSMRRRGFYDNLLAIDEARNNTSIVFTLTWRGWKLLFSGDAEHRSWRIINGHDKLEPVHFFKISHHGSETGMPEGELLEKILPKEPADTKKRYGIVSTSVGTYNGVPAEELLVEELSELCALEWTNKGDIPDGGYIDFLFTGNSSDCAVERSDQME